MKVNIMIMEKYLSKEQYELFSFIKPLEALEKMEEINPDIFLLDVEMDDLNGFELCEKIRNIPKLKETPIIFITSLDDTESLEKGLKVGGTEFLNKDMNPYELNLRINNLIKLCSLNQEIREKNSLLEQKSETYRILVRLLCHDIANPLTMQTLYIDRLKKSDLLKNDPTLEKSLTSLSKSLEQILNIIDHVRQISAIEDGKLVLNISSVNLEEVFEEVKFSFEERLKSKNINLEVISPINTKLSVMADKTSITHQVIANLLSNALKFSFEGQKIILSYEEKGDKVEIRVEDHGVGIPESMVQDLFKSHVKTSRAGTNKEKGTGFGLPLVKSYVEKYGGEIRVESTTKEINPTNHGTTFILSLNKAI